MTGFHNNWVPQLLGSIMTGFHNDWVQRWKAKESPLAVKLVTQAHTVLFGGFRVHSMINVGFVNIPNALDSDDDDDDLIVNHSGV